MEDDEKGFLEPTLDFHEGVVSIDKVYVTNIDEVKGILLRDEEGNINYQVWFSYSKPTGENFQSFRRSYFVLESTTEWKGLTEALCNLSRHYRREKIEEGNHKNRGESKTEESSKEKDSLFYLTKKEQELICTGKEVVGKEVRLLATLSFDDCKYLPEESITGISELNKFKGISSSEKGAILACGNADVRLPNSCQESIPYYNNFQLSFDRANSCAIYLEDNFPELGDHFIISTYPLGTYHNKRSVDLFQVTPK